MNILVRSNNLILLVLFICLVLLTAFFVVVEIQQPQRIVIPIIISFFISILFYIILDYTSKDKFVKKIYLISVLIHFVFILLWQIIKYYLLGLPFPTDNTFAGFISDTDGLKYHFTSCYLANHYDFEHLMGKYYGGLYPKIIATLYILFGKNPFIATCLNSIVAGFISVLLYVISTYVLISNNLCRIYALLCVFCTSFIVNTSVLMRDGYITLFMYLTIYLSFLLLKYKSVPYLILFILSLYMSFLFRPYAALMTLMGIIAGFIAYNLNIKNIGVTTKVNRFGLILFIIAPFVIGGLFFGINKLISSGALYIKELSVETLITVRETSYNISNSTYSWDFGALYHICPLLPFIIGYFCLFCAPFPNEWIYIKRLHFVPDMIVLYMLIPSFIKNIKRIFTNKNYILMVYFFTIICIFTIYCITVGNSGTIHRLRGPYIPMIYLIAFLYPDNFLNKILTKIQKWRII